MTNGLSRVSDGVRVGVFGHRKDKYVGKRGKHVVFIPWDETEGAEWITKTATWNLARNDKFDVVTYKQGDTSIALGTVSGDKAGVVYIRGHGNPGNPYIMSNYKAKSYALNVGLVLPITDACQRLIDSGLLSSFRGAIKFYSCHSGAKLTTVALNDSNNQLRSQQKYTAAGLQQANELVQKLDAGTERDKAIEGQHRMSESLKKGEALAKSMARQGADYMRSKGFKHCVYYGYLGPLGSTYELDTDGDWSTTHKTVSLEGLQKAPKALKGVKDTRPSVARVRV